MVPGFQFRQSFATLSGLVFNDDNRRATANICVCAAKYWRSNVSLQSWMR